MTMQQPPLPMSTYVHQLFCKLSNHHEMPMNTEQICLHVMQRRVGFINNIRLGS